MTLTLFRFVLLLLAGLMGGAFAGCSRSPARQFETIKKNVNPSQLQAWAIELLRKYPDGTNAILEEPRVTEAGRYQGRLVFTNQPAFFRKMPRFGAVGPEIIISPRGPATQRCVEVVFFYGGWGNGHTIAVGNPAFIQPTNARCYRWTPGVYYRVW